LTDDELDELGADALDELVYAAYDLTFQADNMGLQLAYGLVELDEAKEFLADLDTTANPYIDVSYLESTCLLVEMARVLGSAQ
jgi:hypothetical protein